MSRDVQILLATCNGAPYLPAQLDSILAQTHREWRLLVRDDGSLDATPAILAGYQARHPDRITILPDDGQRLGACGNFAALMAAADGDRFMFCDQDDVWLPEKISRSLAVMEELEKRHGSDIPLLVHTDLAVVDGDLRPVADSLWRYQHVDAAAGATLNRLLVQNCATGCTMLFNRAARDLALPVPDAAIMHDWWLVLVTAAFGVIGYLPETTVLYRQHDGNDTGARQWNAGYIGRQLASPGDQRSVIRRVLAQGEAFRDRYRQLLPPDKQELLDAYARLARCNPLLRRWLILRYRFFYTGLLRNFGRLVVG